MGSLRKAPTTPSAQARSAHRGRQNGAFPGQTDLVGSNASKTAYPADSEMDKYNLEIKTYNKEVLQKLNFL